MTKKILKGCQAIGQRKDTRLPITAPILQKLLSALEHTVSQYPTRLLLRAVFLLAFHAFLRLGEITVKSLKSKHQILQRSDATFNQSSFKEVQIDMRDFKSNKHKFPIIISIQSGLDSAYCPVKKRYTITCNSFNTH